MKPIIHFAHGNGFPALCYKQMLDSLGSQFTCCFIDKIGHNDRYPVGENWQYLVHEVLASVKKKADQPVIGLGHSFGGILTLFAAIEEPQLFHSVIMLDSPLIGPFKSIMVKLAKSLGVIDRITPAYRSRGRRVHWQTHEQLMHYLSSRPLFKTFTEECLNDYITYGLDHRKDGYHLRFDRKIEYQIYRTIPDVIPQYKGRLIRPAALLYGDKSSVVSRMDVRYMKKQFNIRCIKTQGTHLFPMEHPQTVAQQIMALING